MKLDIENKILIPFMVLAIIPILIMGIISYWNGYQLLLNDKIMILENNLSESIAYMEILNEKVENGIMTINQGKAEARKYFSGIDKENMIILDGENTIFNNTNFNIDSLKNMISSEPGQVHNQNRLLFMHDTFDNWNWTFIFGIDKTIFSNELLRIQKYILLIAVISLVISMQAIIFIAHSISKPIKKFADICKRIEINNLKEKITINRSDEIGILANSFNNMIDQLNTSTEKLIEMKKFNESILKNIYIGIMTTDKNGKLISVNEAGQKIFDHYGNHKDIYDQLNKQINKTINEENNINTMITFNTVEKGRTLYFDVSTSLLKMENGQINGAICSFNDITRRKTLENNLVRVDRLASVGQFAAGLAHEIRNPLTGIKTSIQVIKNRVLNFTDQSSLELLDGIIYEIDRINNLVAELLDFSKPKKSQREKANLADILQKSLDLNKEGIIRKKIIVHQDVECIHLFVFVDRGQVEQIFLNIINNAIDSMDTHGHLNIKFENSFSDRIPFVIITFEDTGIGMDDNTIKRIFDPFYTTKTKGTGLGLSVVSKLVEENGGKMEIESVVNVGTKFKVFLPLYMEDANED